MKWYKFDIRDLRDIDYKKWYLLMNPDKKYRVDRFRFEDDKKRTVAGEMLARKAISEWCGVAPENIAFSTKEYGKPYAIGLDVEFNVSHSGDIVVCAIDDYPIGIDVEIIRPIDLSISKRFCNKEDLYYLFGHEPTEEDFVYTDEIDILTRFFEIWTKKEAHFKCLGTGLSPECKNENLLADKVKPIMCDNYIITINKKEI